MVTPTTEDERRFQLLIKMLKGKTAALDMQFKHEVARFLDAGQPELAVVLLLYQQGRLSKDEFNGAMHPDAALQRKQLGCPYFAAWVIDTQQKAARLLPDLSNSLKREELYHTIAGHLKQKGRKDDAGVAELVGQNLLRVHPCLLTDKEANDLGHYAQQILIGLGSVEDHVKPRVAPTPKPSSRLPKPPTPYTT